MAPFEKLKSPLQPALPDHLPVAALKPGITLIELEHAATRMTGNEAVRLLNQARNQLFQSIYRRSKYVA